MESDVSSPAENSTPNHVLDPIEKLILRSMSEGVITVECNGTIHMVNQSATRMLGMKEQDLIGKRFDEVFAKDPENKDFEEVFVNVIHQGVLTTQREVQFKRDDGQTVDLAIATSFLEADQCVPGMETVIAVMRDITALKNLERARRRAVDHLSHELKTPLSIIDASLSRLMPATEDGSASPRLVDRIRRNLQRLRDIQEAVEDVVNPWPYHPQPLHILKTVEDVVDQVRREASHRSVAIKTDLEPTETDLLDPQILHAAVKTLLKNAIENTPDEGEVRVAARVTSDGVLVTVEDRGVGVPVEDREFLLEGFHHTQATDEYSSKKPYDFNAGGKGLELLRLKIWSDAEYFDLSFESRRCLYIPTAWDHCPGKISECPHVQDREGCRASGGTRFSLLFRGHIQPDVPF